MSRKVHTPTPGVGSLQQPHGYLTSQPTIRMLSVGGEGRMYASSSCMVVARVQRFVITARGGLLNDLGRIASFGTWLPRDEPSFLVYVDACVCLMTL